MRSPKPIVAYWNSFSENGIFVQSACKNTPLGFFSLILSIIFLKTFLCSNLLISPKFSLSDKFVNENVHLLYKHQEYFPDFLNVQAVREGYFARDAKNNAVEKYTCREEENNYTHHLSSA